jgi:hypothetical protein
MPPAANVAKVCRKKHSQRDRDIASMVGEAEALDIPAVNLAPRRQEWGEQPPRLLTVGDSVRDVKALSALQSNPASLRSTYRCAEMSSTSRITSSPSRESCQGLLLFIDHDWSVESNCASCAFPLWLNKNAIINLSLRFTSISELEHGE